MKSIEERVMTVIKEQVGLTAPPLSVETDFINNLGFDSLDGLEVVMAIENEFEIDIDDGEIESVKTVADAIALVTRTIGEQQC